MKTNTMKTYPSGTSLKATLFRCSLSVMLAMAGIVLLPASEAALTIGAEGWTADTPAGVTYGGLVGGIGPGDGSFGVLPLAGGTGSYTFEIQLASAVNVSTTIHFVNSMDATDESYFRLSFKGTNTGAADWLGVNFVINDVTTDPIPVQVDGTGHPDRAHIHRNVWTDGAYTKADAYTGSNGRYTMALLLAAPLTTGNNASGATLRLHDINEPGTDPMRFDLIITPVPEPGTWVTGIALCLPALLAFRRRKGV